MQVIPRNYWTTERSRELRQGENPAEGALWNVLKASQLGGHKFVRQHPIGPYFADFAHRQRKLFVEVDGSQHVGNVHDENRDAYLLRVGYSVLRFWSRDVLQRRADVCDTILSVLEDRMTPTTTIDVNYKRACGPSPSRALRDPPLP